MLHVCDGCGSSEDFEKKSTTACRSRSCTGTMYPITARFPSVTKQKHPMQPVGVSKNGIVRFKSNAIVERLLTCSGVDLNQLLTMEFSNEDLTQFVQLTGASVSHASEQPWFDSAVLALAQRNVAALLSTDYPESRRASGDMTCSTCGHPYWKHPHSQHRDHINDDPYLHVLCNGDMVHL